MLEQVKSKIKSLLHSKGLRSFITTSKKQSARLLDVGCGNESSVFSIVSIHLSKYIALMFVIIINLLNLKTYMKFIQ